MSEKPKRNPELLNFLPESCVVDELHKLFLANTAAINAYCGRDVTSTLNHYAAEDSIPYYELSNTVRYPDIKFNNFCVSCIETTGPEGVTVFRTNPRELIESLMRAIEFLDEAFGFDAAMVANWQPILDLSKVEHFTFAGYTIPLTDQIYLCPALRWDRETTTITPKQIKDLLGIIRKEGN